MPPSLQTVVRRMNLRPLAGTTGPGVLDAPVRWVAVSELADPTPYLEGGELLLTTGMRMAGDLTGYVARLVHRGVAGLGFGVGVSHEEVPPALVEAAEAAGLPLLEVPRETPFIAIGKAVSELLAAEQYEEISRAFAAQGRLTRAALRPEGMHAVIDRLAREVGGWAALLDESGEVRHATRGADTVAVTSELARLRGAGPGSGAGSGAQVGERVGRLPASLALSGPGRHIVLQPLGGGPRPKGFFAVGAPQAFSPVAHTVINAAGSLLTLAMEQGRAQLAAERRVRTSVLELLLAGEWDRARTVLGALGGRLPEAPLVVLAADADALETLETHGFAATLGGDSDGDLSGYGSGGRDSSREGSGGPVADGGQSRGVPGEGVVVALVAEGAAEGVAWEAAVSAEASVGVSQPCGPGAAELRNAIDQAGRALEAARSRRGARPDTGGPGEGPPPGRGTTPAQAAGQGRVPDQGAASGREPVAGRGAVSGRGTVSGGEPVAGKGVAAGRGAVSSRGVASGKGVGGGDGRAGVVVRFDELAGQGLLSLLDPAAAHAFSAAVLAPLTAYGSKADLVGSLRAYLDSNGHWDAAAQKLGVHRHTLRYRMRRVADLLGRDLDDPGTRAELWLALEAARRGPIPASPPGSSR